MFYVQRNGNGYLETVDEFESRSEARKMLAEYRICDPSAEYYLSSRPCRVWTEAAESNGIAAPAWVAAEVTR